MVDWISKGKVTLCVVLVGGSVGFELDELIDGCNSLPLSEVEADEDPMVAGVAGVWSGSPGEVDVFSRGTNAKPDAPNSGWEFLAGFMDCSLVLRYEAIIWPDFESAFRGPRGGRWCWLLHSSCL